MWGHNPACRCSLCPSVVRLHRIIRAGTFSSATQACLDFATVRVRNLIGELSDFVDAHQPGTGEGLAHPPSRAGGSDGGKGGGRAEGDPERREAGERATGVERAGKERSEDQEGREVSERASSARREHHPRDRDLEEEEDSEDNRAKNLSAKSKAAPKEEECEETGRTSVKREADQVEKEAEEADQEPGVREVSDKSPHHRRRHRKEERRSAIEEPQRQEAKRGEFPSEKKECT